MPNYFIIVVLYGKKLSESSTIRSLIGFSDFMRGRCRLLVWDNSPEALASTEIEGVKKSLCWLEFEYHHNGGTNVPLSCLYNQSIQLLHEDEYLVILDDDSTFTPQLFLKADNSIAKYPTSDLFLPIVRNNNDIVSPATMVMFKGHYLKKVSSGIMPCHHRTAINSGMIISARYLKHQFEGYDERIRFYFTDNDFMSRYNASHTDFVVLDYEIAHKLNFYEKGENFEVKSLRFKELRHSFLILMRRKGLLQYLLTELYLFIYSIKFAIIHRNIRFIFIR